MYRSRSPAVGGGHLESKHVSTIKHIPITPHLQIDTRNTWTTGASQGAGKDGPLLIPLPGP
jgi:hypothetical protein